MKLDCDRLPVTGSVTLGLIISYAQIKQVAPLGTGGAVS